MKFGYGILLGLMITSCADKSERLLPVDEAIEQGVLLRGNGVDPESLDPHLATSVSAGNVLLNLFEGLTRLNPKTLEPEPGMAEKWEVSEDGLSIEFTLRPARWSDGKAVTAHDFVYAFSRLLHPELGASYAFMLYPLQHATAINRGELGIEELGVEALDERRLRIRLEKPTPYIFSLLAHWTAFPLPQHVVEQFGGPAHRGGEWTREENLVVNGAFTLSSWEMENRLTLKKNEAYWQADTVRLQGAVYIPFVDAGTEERAFRAGEIHVTYTLPRHRLPHYQTQKAETLRVDPYLQSVGMAVNLSHEGLQDLRVRKALSMALDRRGITESVLYGMRDPAFHYVPPGMAGFSSIKTLTENEVEARKLLEAAGYPGGEGFPRLRFLYPAGQDTQRVAEVVQQQWLRVLGIRVEIDNVERQTYFSRRREREFDLVHFGWVGDYVDPTTFLGLWVKDAGNNLAGWDNSDYDRLLFEAASAGDQRLALLAQAESLLLDDLPIIPLYFGTTQYLKDPRVKGWDANLLDMHPLRVVSFETFD